MESGMEGWKWFGEVRWTNLVPLLPHPCRDEHSVVGADVGIDGFEQQHHYCGSL